MEVSSAEVSSSDEPVYFEIAAVPWHEGAPIDLAGTILQQEPMTEPFGEFTQSTPGGSGTPDPRLGFQGPYNDPLSGSYHMRARDYAANSGRFNSVDPLARSTGDPAQSSYAFGDNNPISNSDPSGMGCGILSFACNAASSAYHEVKQAVTTTVNTVVQVTTDVVNKGVELVRTPFPISRTPTTRSRKTLWIRPRRSYTTSPTPPTKWAIGSTSIRLRSPVSPHICVWGPFRGDSAGTVEPDCRQTRGPVGSGAGWLRSRA